MANEKIRTTRHDPNSSRSPRRAAGRRRKRLSLETLEPRIVLSAAPQLLDLTPDAASSPQELVQPASLAAWDGGAAESSVLAGEGEGSAGTACLTIYVNGDQVVIPANVGIQADGTTAAASTTDTSGTLQLTSPGVQTLGGFFDIWRTNAGLAGNDSSAVLSSTQLLSYVADGSSDIQMFVNGQVSTAFDSYVLQDGDEIVLAYGGDPIVSLNTNWGPIVVELFESQTPGTVANFLNYINDGDFDNSIFHRSVTDFVIQGGGFTTTSATLTSTDQFSEIPADATIANEPGLSNLRGTVAMAKLSGDPDSATSQFFVNLSDDNTFLDSETYGAFTVFGQVLDMATVDEIAALPIDTSNASPFGELPVSSAGQLAVIESIAGQGSLTGVKFLDANANGVLDAGESGIAGVTVYLDADNDGVQDAGEITTTTDAEGRFLLRAEPGSYTLRAESSSNAYATLPATSNSYAVTTTIGSATADLAFGEAEADGGTTDTGDTTDTSGSTVDSSSGTSISGYVYLDTDGDGQRGSAEIGVPGVVITLTGTDSAAASVNRSTLTDSDGSYAFADLAAGTYQVAESQPQSLLDSTESTSASGAVAGDDQISNLVLSEGQTLDENNFGELGLRAPFITIAWFLASTPPVEEMLRQTIARGELLAGNTILAEAILNGGTDVPEDVNAAPVATADAYTVAQDGILTATADTGVLANDTDPDGDVLTATLVTDPSDGVVTFASDGSFSYTPDSGFTGTDTFTYQAGDGLASSNVATVTIGVTAASASQAPTAGDDAYAVAEDGLLTVDAEAGILANDSDPDGDALTAQLTGSPSNGTLVLNADGSFTYTPNADFHGSDTFLYAASDGLTTSAETAVTIYVNDGAAVQNDSYAMEEDGTLEVDAASGVLANDADPDGDALSVALLAGPGYGTLILNLDGSFTYTPDANFFGTDSFTYVVHDGWEASSPASATIAVAAVDDAPLAADDAYEAAAGETLTVAASQGVLANDGDADGDVLTAVLASAPVYGSLTLNTDGSFSYVSPSTLVASDSFSYTVTAGGETSAPATVVITVAQPDLAQVRLEVASTDGTPVSAVEVGQTLVVNAFVTDLRTSPQGVFASYFDLLYDSSLVSVVGEGIEYGEDFPNGHRADSSTLGTVADAGGFAGFTQLGSGEFRLVSVTFVALASGRVEFTADTTNLSTGGDTLLYGRDTSVPFDQVLFVDASLDITAAGEGEADASSGWAADVDQAFAEADWLPFS